MIFQPDQMYACKSNLIQYKSNIIQLNLIKLKYRVVLHNLSLIEISVLLGDVPRVRRRGVGG